MGLATLEQALERLTEDHRQGRVDPDRYAPFGDAPRHEISGFMGQLNQVKFFGRVGQQANAGECKQFIEQARLTEVKLSARTCLRCDRPFLSQGPWNRLCSKCRSAS